MGHLRVALSFARIGLADDVAAEAHRNGVRPAAGLKLRKQVPDMALDRLLGEEEPDADLAVHETVGNQLENLHLTGGRLLLQLLQRWGLERDHLCHAGIPTSGHGFEPSRVLGVPRKDLVALCSVHNPAIGPRERQL